MVVIRGRSALRAVGQKGSQWTIAVHFDRIFGLLNCTNIVRFGANFKLKSKSAESWKRWTRGWWFGVVGQVFGFRWLIISTLLPSVNECWGSFPVNSFFAQTKSTASFALFQFGQNDGLIHLTPHSSLLTPLWLNFTYPPQALSSIFILDLIAPRPNLSIFFYIFYLLSHTFTITSSSSSPPALTEQLRNLYRFIFYYLRLFYWAKVTHY